MQGFEEAAVIISTDGLGYQVEQRIEHKPDSSAAKDGSIESQALAAVGIRGDKRAASTRQGGLSDPYSSGGGGGSGLGSDPFEDLGMAAAAAAAGVSKKPLSLRDQLAANKAAAEEAWKEKHNPFKPPPGLDEDDFNRYEDLELARRSRHEQAREQDAQDFTLFQIALQQKELAVRAMNDAATPIGSAVPLPEPEKMLDPSLRFGPGAGSAATGGAALLAPLSPASSNTAAAAASAAAASASSTTSAPGVASLPTLVLLKRKHSSEDHSHSSKHNHAADTGSASAAKDSAEKHAKKKKKHRKDKDAANTDSAAATTTGATAATAATTSAVASAAEPAESGLAGLIGAYGSDDDE